MKNAIPTILLLAALMATVPTRAAEKVDLLLVLAADVSRSMDEPKFKLQRSGYVEALTSAEVIQAIKSGPAGRIAIMFMEFSGADAQKVVLDWALISDESSAHRFADTLTEIPRSFDERTAIGAGIDFAALQLKRTPFEASRRTIDISGDGTSNVGRNVRVARDEAIAAGITINGIPILSSPPVVGSSDHTNPPGGLESYYLNNVVGGPGAFIMAADDFRSFGKALIRKLIAEVAEMPVAFGIAERR